MRLQSVNPIYKSRIHTDNKQGYPEEWFPSVSATIGDRYPERSVFMLFIALTSGRSSGDTLKTQANHHQVLDWPL
jgi:hypothetical protein